VPIHRLPLRGADLVLMGMQALWKDARVSNNALLVVDCDGTIDPSRVGRALDKLLDMCPWPAARLRRSFPWGQLHWASGPRASLAVPRVRHHCVELRQDLHVQLESEVNETIDPRREAPLRVLVVDWKSVPPPPRSVLVLTWFHPLMDPRGAQNLLMHLTHLDSEKGPAPWDGAPPGFVTRPDTRSLKERGRLARRSLAYMRTLMQLPPVSPGTSLTAPGLARFRLSSFGDDGADGSGAREAREICSRLAAVGKAMAELWERRGLPDLPFFVPIAVDLRPKGEPGATFGNLLAFHFARFKPSETADIAHLARTLRRQMADAVRDGQVEANAVAMEFLKYRPLSMMLRELPGTRTRETFSFNCADVMRFPLDSVFGRRVLNAYHVPAVMPRPGIGIFFNRCESTTNVVTSWIEGAVSENEVARIVDVIGKGLGWRRIA